MNSRRTALIVMLVAAEVLIVGYAIHAMAGGGSWGGNSWNHHGPWSMQSVSYNAHPFAPIDAGASPVVTISDEHSQVTLTASTDGRVHVQDETNVGSSSWNASGKIPQLQVTRTGDGVSIVRPDYDDIVSIGFSDTRQEIAVQVPPGARIQIVKCDGADVTGVQNDVNVESGDGDIGLHNLHGNIVAHSGDGHVEIENSQGSSIDLSSDDGHLTITDVSAESLTVHSGDGSIRASGVTIAGAAPRATVHSDDGSVEVAGTFAAAGTYEISSADGHVNVALGSGSNTTVNASTEDGSISMNGQSSGDDDNNSQTLRVGDGTGAMRVASDDGSIHITTNGAN